MVEDPLLNDQALVVKTEEGLLIVLGCAHAGMINTIEYAMQITGENRIHTVMGGTHLGPVSPERREKTIAALKQYNIRRLGAAHCTGIPVTARLMQEFGDSFLSCNVGVTVTM